VFLISRQLTAAEAFTSFTDVFQPSHVSTAIFISIGIRNLVYLVKILLDLISLPNFVYILRGKDDLLKIRY
jgi:hypothetical protein